MNITGSKTTDFSVTVPDNITGSRTEEKEVKKKNVYVAETNSLITVPEDYTPAQQVSAARQEEFEKINEYTDSQKFWNKYVFDPTKSTGRFAKTLLKSAANQTVDLTGGSLLRLEEWAENTGAEIAYDVAKEKGMDYPGALLELRKDAVERNRNLLDKAMFNIGEEESEIAQNLGSGAVSIGSMFLAWGLGNKRFALDLAKIFGLSSGTSMYENLTLAGAPYDTATYRGAVAGISEYALEKAGFEWVTNRIQNRLLYPITKRFIEPGFAGAVQESLQEGKDILLEEGYVESTPEEKFDRLSTAAIYGAILETAGANVGYELYRRRMRENLRQAAIEDGYDTKTADKMAKAATPSTNEMLNILRDEERRTLDGLEKFTPEQMEEYEKSLELTRNLPTEDAAAEVQFYDGLKNVILKGGIEENEARRQAAYWSLMVKNDYELAKESGAHQGNMAEFQRKWIVNIANRKNTRAVKAGNRVVETPVRMTEDEISEAWAARQQERQMSDEEREFFAERPSRKLFSLGDRQTDFTEFRGNPEGAIEKLLQEKNGYVSGAVYKEGIGDIDFIYGQPGKNGYGLAHIIERRNQQGINGEEFVREIPELIKSGNVYTQLNYPGRKYIVSGDKEAAVRLDWNGENRNWLVTAYMKKNKGALVGFRTYDQTRVDEQSFPSSNSFDTENISSDMNNVKEKGGKLFSKEAKTDINTPEFKAWFGNSKVVDEKGQPLKMVHFSNNEFSQFDKSRAGLNNDESSIGFWFADRDDFAFNNENHPVKYDVYLKMENPLIIEGSGTETNPWADTDIDNLDPYTKFEKMFNDLMYQDPRMWYERVYEPVYGGFETQRVKLHFSNFSEKKQREVIKGITDKLKAQGYDGIIIKNTRFDSLNPDEGINQYVVFEPNQIKSVYNQGTWNAGNDNIYYSRTGETVRGAYDPSERLIELFADAKPDTLTHELSHHFFMNHFRVAQEYGFSEYDRGVMKWLSKQGKHEINGFADMQGQDWENLTEAFIRYLNTGNAPTIATRGIFQKAKEWVLRVYDINRDYASNEVKDFFDALVSREGEIPNIDNIIQNKADFEEAAKRALRGEGATFRGQSIKDIRALRKAINTRVRRPGKTLAQELRALGYRIDNVNRTLVDEKGVVEDARLAEILQELGVLDNVATETYEQTEALSSKMQEILSNADTTYSPREARIRQERETSVANQAKAQQFIDELLKDNQLGIKTIEELDEMLARILSKPDNTDIVKVNRDAIKYLQAKNAEMNKNYREAIRQVKQAEKVRRETQYQLQKRIKDFIQGLPVTGDHKAALMGNIQRVKDADSFEKVLADVRTRAAGYIEQEQKQLNRRNIEETIKSTKPTKFRKQRYTYEDNTFFAEMRDILKMSQEEARAAQEAFAGQIGLQRADNDNTPLDMNISEYDRLKNLLYYYKINGAESSLTALQDLATSLEELKAEAMTKRLDEDELKSAVRKKDKNELLDGINKYKASNIFARGMARIGTVRSAMSEYFGKKMADKWNLETDFEKVNIFMRSKIKPVMDKARKIYGTRRASDFLNLMQQKSRQEFELTDNDGDYDRLSIMEIADIYIGMKDPNTRANYYAAYEKFDDTMPTDRGQLRAAIETMSDEQLREHLLTNNLGTLLSHLSEQDMRFADMVQEEVGSMWELENEIFVKMYGIDLPRNKNYFPRTSKNSLDYDVMENLRVRGQTPGFFKERASTVTPRPKNIWTKYQEYVTSVGYVQNVALKYKDLHALMTDKAIRGAVVKKYGDAAYRAFMANLDDLSIKGAVKTYNEVGKTMQQLLNNLVSGTVALNVPMAIKQLPAALNYSVNMPKTEFVKNFLYAATHPAEVKRVMEAYVGDFLHTRFEQGSQSDAIGRAMAEADSLVNSKFGLAGFSHSWRTLATIPIRFADIFAIYWGGYAKLKYNIDRGLTPEKIREDFIDETLSNQAAGNPATLAKFQREQSLRFFTAFRNVPAQYMRLITTTMTQWRRGEISDARFYSNIGNYVFAQPALYIWLGWLVKSFLYGDDDDEWYDGMMTEMAVAPIAGLPIIADLASFGLDKAESALTGKSPEPWDALQVFGVDTLNRLMWKLMKDDKTGWDWAEILASVVDVGTGAGLGTAVRTVKKMAD